MAQHFLLSAECRNFSRRQLESLSDEQHIALMARLRWGSETCQVCPACGHVAKHYWRANRQQWRCRSCGRDFSVTSGTAFHGHKLSIRDILTALYTFINSAKSVSATELARELGCQWKTAWLLTQKLREAILKSNRYTPVEGIAQMDGGYFCGKRRSPNRHGQQRDERAIADKIEASRSMRNKRRLQLSAGSHANAKRKKKRRCVCVLREVSPTKGEGARRTLVYIARNENQADMTQLATLYTAQGTLMMTDESSAFSELPRWFDHRTVVHSQEWVKADGTNDNQAESYFSRLRRAEYGVFHGFRPMYLIDYASEFAWREDNRGRTMRELFDELLRLALKNGHSTWFAKYYQGNRRREEIMGPADGRRFARKVAVMQ